MRTKPQKLLFINLLKTKDFNFKSYGRPYVVARFRRERRSRRSDLPSQRGRWIFCNLLQKRRMRDFFLIFTPISLTAQRNGGKTAKETPSNPCSLLPQTLSPYIRGLKRTAGRKCFLIPTAIVQADGGFLFRFFARPVCFD